ncbi:MAG TPA: DNA alkylation repair protein [Anaerovoracaceae bacterium]|nr:DNA alkylation repair protein [Anaerovoracaceae bacterium]
MNQTIRERIFDRAEEEYKKFQSKLIPGEDRLLGVRLPYLKELAKEIAKEDWREYLNNAQDEYYEEIMLQGLVIGYAKAEPQEILHYTAQFIPKITNWGVCDSFCTGLKLAKKHPQLVWDFIQPYLKSGKEFEIRFAVIMMLAHFIADEFIDQVITNLDKVHHDGYYVKMGVAWAISVCFVKYPDKTMAYLKNSNLDNFTFNKSLQKILESYRVDQEAKVIIRSMKRKSTTK